MLILNISDTHEITHARTRTHDGGSGFATHTLAYIYIHI